MDLLAVSAYRAEQALPLTGKKNGNVRLHLSVDTVIYRHLKLNQWPPITAEKTTKMVEVITKRGMHDLRADTLNTHCISA